MISDIWYPDDSLWLNDYYIVIGNFNVQVDDTIVSGFCNTFDLVGLIKKPMCYKNPEKPSSHWPYTAK